MDSNTSSAALASGAIDFANVCDADFLTAYPQNPHMRFTNPAQVFVGSAILARKDSPLKTFQDFVDQGMSPKEAIRAAGAQLAGATAIATHNSDQELAVFIGAKKGGVDPAGMKFIDLAADDGLAAFLSGEGDVYSGGLPQRARAVDEGAKVILSGTQLAPEGVVLCGYATTDTYLAEHSDVVVKMQRAFYETMSYIAANPDKGFQIIIDKLKSDTGQVVSLKDMRGLWNHLELFAESDDQMAKFLLGSDSKFYWKDRFEYVYDFYRNAGTIKGDIDLNEAYAYPKVHKLYAKMFGDN